jgi:hypothetical protein
MPGVLPPEAPDHSPRGPLPSHPCWLPDTLPGSPGLPSARLPKGIKALGKGVKTAKFTANLSQLGQQPSFGDPGSTPETLEANGVWVRMGGSLACGRHR